MIFNMSYDLFILAEHYFYMYVYSCGAFSSLFWN